MTYYSRPRDAVYPQGAYYPPNDIYQGRHSPHYRDAVPVAATATAHPRPHPRRSNSDRYHQRPDPDDRGAWQRHENDDFHRSSHRNEHARRAARSPPPPPPPSHRYDDRRAQGEPRREYQDPRELRHSRNEHDFARDSRNHRNPRHPQDPRTARDEGYYDEPRRHRRNKTVEEPYSYRQTTPDKYSRGRDYPLDARDRYGDAAYARAHARNRSPAAGPRPRTGDLARPAQDEVDYGGRHAHRGHRSHSHGKDRPKGKANATPSPHRGRHRHTSTRSGGSLGAKARSTTVPAQAAKWWSHPIVQAGARTALSAGAQAAMNNRGVQGDWLGSKGAKVATAALGAALMDGFVNTGHAGGGSKDDHRKKKERSRARSDSRGHGDDREHDGRRSKSRGKSGAPTRSKSEGRSGMRDKILQSGMDYMLKRAANAR